MSPEELKIVRSALARRREAYRLARAVQRQAKDEAGRVERELALVLEELQGQGVPEDILLDTAFDVLRERLSFDAGGKDPLHEKDHLRF